MNIVLNLIIKYVYINIDETKNKHFYISHMSSE
jgi:hypothetical protein